jgi:hypothetical protein
MTKIEEVKNETIDNQIKVWEKIETIYPETIQTPDYSYWTNQNTIDWQIAIRNLSTWWWQYYCEFKTKSSWIWVVSYTWIWFTPKLVKITATYASSKWSQSFWVATTTANQSAIWNFFNPDWTTTYSTWEIIQVRNNDSSSRVYGILQSIDTDWITINFTRCDMSCQFQLECYW